MVFFRPSPDAELTVRSGDLCIPVTIRRNPKAVRLTLRLAPRGDGAILTAPRSTSFRHLQSFLDEHRDWLIQTYRSVPKAIPLIDGAEVSFQGRTITLRNDPNHRGKGRLVGGTLVLGGKEPHFPRRVRDWLKTEARAKISALVREKTERSDLKAGRITIRDQVTRWGSCAANGNLAFSWRLICADPKVLDYVVAHEVAHLRHMNHSHEFWALADSLSEDMTFARGWLRDRGTELHRIGM